jgi:lipopolysaccharide biosynthesis glycosyltransferase
MSSFFDGNVPIGRFPADEFHIACKQPKIIHYSNVSKPWHFFNTHPFLNHYTKHLQKTPWSTSLDEMNHLFIEYFTSRKIVVFGTGECSNWVKEVLNKHNLDIAWYVDNNQKKQGSFIFETAIFGPEKLLTCNLTDYVIIIASMYHQEISEQLTAMNLKEKINFMIYGYEHRFLEMLKNQ